MLQSRIGPERIYPVGFNVFAQGDIYAEFSVATSFRLGVMEFGSTRRALTAPPYQMRQLARLLRAKCTRAFGVLSYDRSALPIKVIAHKKKGMMELRLPEPCNKVAANPEMWLALAEAIDTTAAAMG